MQGCEVKFNKLMSTWAEEYIASRGPDYVIGIDRTPPYLKRWWVIPRNKLFNIYLHEIQQDDDDRALHDHPWVNMSYVISGGYHEVTKQGTWIVPPGTFRFRRPTTAHRLVLAYGKRTVTLFITGPVIREWGFLCPQGWRHWKDFVAVREGGNDIGRGCE